MYAMTTELIHEHQQTLLAEVTQARRGDHLARAVRLRRRAVQAARPAPRANAQLS